MTALLPCRILLLGWTTLLFFEDRPLTAEKPKAAVPPAAAQALAVRKVRKAFAAEFRAKDREARSALAGRLVEAARTETDAAVKYVLLTQARKIAEDLADAGRVTGAVDALFAAFDVHAVDVLAAALARTARNARDPAAAKALTDAAFAAVDRCIDAQLLRPMKTLETLIRRTAKKAKDDAFAAAAEARVETARARFKEREARQAQLQEAILKWARTKVGEQVGGGECLDFVRAALAAAGAETRLPYYTFGRRLYPGEMPRPGDVLAHIYTDGAGTGRHHVVLITEVAALDRFAILHQNVSNVRRVVEGRYDMKSVNCDAYYIYRPRLRE